VVGVDGSVAARNALDWAVAEARLRRGRLHVVTAWQMPPVMAGMEEALPWTPQSLARAATNIQARALKRVDTGEIDISTEVQEGHPGQVLIDASRDADLLVVGSRGLGGFTGLLLGSVSTLAVRHAACTVLVVRPQDGTVPESRIGR